MVCTLNLFTLTFKGEADVIDKPVNDEDLKVMEEPTLVTSPSDVNDGNYSYQPVIWHWFYLKEIDKTKRIWKPFSMLDSVALEEAFHLRKTSLPLFDTLMCNTIP